VRNAVNLPSRAQRLIDDESLVANEMIVTVDHPERGPFTTVGSPLELSDSPVTVKRSPLLASAAFGCEGKPLELAAGWSAWDAASVS
jgi:crotonobetainyl-CoA:carnitine CoA-transferase CaiB-like acyl-CoA transferase